MKNIVKTFVIVIALVFSNLFAQEMDNHDNKQWRYSILTYAAGSSLDGFSSYGHKVKIRGHSPDGALKGAVFVGVVGMEWLAIHLTKNKRVIQSCTVINHILGASYTGLAMSNWVRH